MSNSKNQLQQFDFTPPLSDSSYPFTKINDLNKVNYFYSLGLQGLNQMLSGGIRRGQAMGIESLHRRFKSGICDMILTQVPIFNTPMKTPVEAAEESKPMILKISFDDSIEDSVKSIYRTLKAVDKVYPTPKDIEKFSFKKIATFVNDKVTATGFHIRMLKMHPSQCDYESITQEIEQLESEGYTVHILIVDHLFSKNTSVGSQDYEGREKLNLVRSIRNYCHLSDIALISPFNLSTEAAKLLKSGIPEHDFVNAVAGKNYTAHCQRLDQALDLVLYTHLFKDKGTMYVAFRRGKHRVSQTLKDSEKFCMYSFTTPSSVLLPDVNGESTALNQLPLN